MAALLAGAALILSGCGLADSHAVWPEVLKVKANEPAPLEAPPDVKRLVAGRLDSVFTAGSQPAHVRVSAPLHDPRGTGWTACVRAELTSVIGKPLGMRGNTMTFSQYIGKHNSNVGQFVSNTAGNYGDMGPLIALRLLTPDNTLSNNLQIRGTLTTSGDGTAPHAVDDHAVAKRIGPRIVPHRAAVDHGHLPRNDP